MLSYKMENGKLFLSKIREVPLILYREIRGKIKGVIIKREKSGKWYAVFQAEDEDQLFPTIERKIGIDVGIERFGKIKDREYTASLNILSRGLLGQGQPLEPVETEPLRELVKVPASSIIEAGSPLR